MRTTAAKVVLLAGATLSAVSSFAASVTVNGVTLTGASGKSFDDVKDRTVAIDSTAGSAEIAYGRGNRDWVLFNGASVTNGSAIVPAERRIGGNSFTNLFASQTLTGNPRTKFSWETGTPTGSSAGTLMGISLTGATPESWTEVMTFETDVVSNRVQVLRLWLEDQRTSTRVSVWDEAATNWVAVSSETANDAGDLRWHRVTISNVAANAAIKFGLDVSRNGTGGFRALGGIALEEAYAITASGGANGSLEPDGRISVFEGADQPFVCVPSNGYAVSGMTVDGDPTAAAGGYLFTNVTADHTIDVSFTNGITITASAETGGGIAPWGGVPVGVGSDQAFAITPDPGYRIFDVAVDGVSTGVVSTHTFENVQSNHAISATFMKTYAITAASVGGGTIAPSGSVTVDAGSNQTFTITADSGQRVAAVLVDGVSVGSTNAYTFNSVSADHTIEVGFGPDVAGYHKAVKALGPLNYWRLDDSSGGAEDAGTQPTNGVYGSRVDRAAWGPRPSSLIGGARLSGFEDGNTGAGYLGGSGQNDPNSVITMGNYSPVSGGNARTVLAWVNPTTFASGIAPNLSSTVLTYGSETGGQRFHLNLTSDGRIRVHYTAGRNYTTTGSISTNEWSFIALTLPDSAFQRDTVMYLNGALAPGAASAPSDDVNTPSPSGLGFTVGRFSGQPLDFMGTIDEVAIFDRQLTVYEVANLFLAAQKPEERSTVFIIR